MVFQPGALLSVALFEKQINSFVQTLSSSGTFSSNPFGLPDSAAIAACGTSYPATCSPAFPNWTFTVPTNTPGGTLKGIELNYQQPLRFLPWFLKNTGILLNYTYITSSIKYENGAGVVVAEDDLTGLSRHAANATFYYEDKVFSARVSAAYRNKYLTRVPGQQGTDLEGTAGTLNIDASAQISLTHQIKLTFEGINLTDEHHINMSTPARSNRSITTPAASSWSACASTTESLLERAAHGFHEPRVAYFFGGTATSWRNQA